MAIYLYDCPEGHWIESWQRADNLLCPIHLATAQRKWSVNQKHDVAGEHYNFALGQYVKSDRDFDEKLKIANDTNGTRIVRVDPGDVPRPDTGDGGEIFDTQMRTLTDRGYVGSDGKVTIDDAGRFVRRS